MTLARLLPTPGFGALLMKEKRNARDKGSNRKFQLRSFPMQSEINESAPLAARARLTHFALFAVLIALFPSLAHGGTWVPFGPLTYVRGTGDAVIVTNAFSLLNPSTQYTLHVVNGGLGDSTTELASASIITINGVQVVGANNFNRSIAVLDVPVALQYSNTIAVQVRGKPGGVISVQIIGVDNDPPVISATVSPAPNAAGWNNSDVTVSFACSDKTSGVAFCPPPVSVTTEGANQVISGTATDLAGNTATTSVTVNLDKTPPVISGSINPPPDAAGWNYTNVTVSFTCADALSGLASCTSPVAVTTEGANQVVMGTATDVAGNTATANVTVNISRSFFYVRNYGGKCLDFGPPPQVAGSPVFIYGCNGTEAQRIRVQEINDRHDVVLHAGTAVIGIHNPPVNTQGAPPPPLQTEYALELQSYHPMLATTANQIFALDGDSIILASSRPCPSTDTALCSPPPPPLVVQIQNARGANRSPLVASLRNLADSEFWDFFAVDGSDKDPTTGFVRVALLCDLLKYIPLYDASTNPCPTGGTPSPATPGTVIKIDQGATIGFSGVSPLQIPGGVTIRGSRRGTLLGPCLHKEVACDDYSSTPNAPGESMLEIKGDDVRITGLRLQGTSRTTDEHQVDSIGVLAHDGTGVLAHDGTTLVHEQYLHSIIDHNDISAFTKNGVGVQVDDAANIALTSVYDSNDNPFTRPLNVMVARNFIHHNRMQNFGYGVESNWGGFPLVEGNTFVSNRHAIAAGFGSAHSGYRAWLNLVLSDAPLQIAFINFYTHDFDMHGDVFDTNNGFGGQGGDYVDIFGNTFLGTNRVNYELRAQPCHYTDVHFNVSLHSKEDTLRFKDSNNQIGNRIEYMNIADVPNQFGLANPTDHLGVGDFDGDGIPDLFLATGAAWYYSPGGNAEWRFLNGGKTDRIDSLLLGDFDGDGRTDVVGINGSNLMVSWGGVSDWEVLNSLPAGASITDLAVGDFDGDGRADIFYADGTNWYVSSGGSGPFNNVITSSFRVKDLRFGDFNGDGKTDVFGVGNGGWQVSYSATSGWTPLPVSLTNAVNGLVVADFNGDGFADVATSTPIFGSINGIPALIGWNWMIWYNGTGTWTSQSCSTFLSTNPLCVSLSSVVGIGNFDGNPGADILLWNGSNVWIASGGFGVPQRLSRQDMR